MFKHHLKAYKCFDIVLNCVEKKEEKSNTMEKNIFIIKKD